jgi:hypothetical protein
MHFACKHMQQDTRTRKGKDSLTYLDPQDDNDCNINKES